MDKELFVKTCSRCGLVFRTPNKNETVCPSCEKFSQKNQKRKIKKKTPDLSILGVTRLLTAYNESHNTLYTYGQFVKMLSLGQIKLEE